MIYYSMQSENREFSTIYFCSYDDVESTVFEMFLVCIFFKTVDVGLFVKIRGFSSGAGSFVGYKLIKQTLPMFLIKHLQIPKRFLQCMHGQRKMKKKKTR